MKKENNKEIDYKIKRESYRECGNKFLETYYQILIVQEIEKKIFSFRKKEDLKQHWYILSGLLNEILGIEDTDYQKGIYYEVILSGREAQLSGDEKECEICSNLLKKHENQEYVDGAWQLHINIIIEIARADVEAAQMYADNLLTLLKVRYGINSLQYAKMKLHIIGEYYYPCKKEVFLYEFEKNYDYLKNYTEECDSYFCTTLIAYVFLIEERKDKDSGIWMLRCEKAIERRQKDEFYYSWKCDIARLKARVLKRENKLQEALDLLQETIVMCQKQNNKMLFCGYIYVMAANLCFMLQDIVQMTYYAQEGLTICENLNLCDSELYFELRSYIGIMYISCHNWEDAEKLYASNYKEIARKFGTENENYIICISNLALLANYQGKDADIYIKELRKIKNADLRKKYRSLFNNRLCFSIGQGDPLLKIKGIYKQCIDDMREDNDEQEWERLDTLYLSALTGAGKFDDEAYFLMDNLAESYKNDFSGELACIYWNSRLLGEWDKGNLQTALEIAERLVHEMPEERYEMNRQIVMNDIQLLILDGQYGKSKKLILSMVKLFHNRILDVGFGNISQYLISLRYLVSMDIQIFKEEGNFARPKGEEARLLLEEIIYCKTIDREIKGLLGKHEEDESMDLYYFRQDHRKLAALEMGEKIGKLDKQEYEQKRMKCLFDLASHRSGLSDRISLHNLLPEYKMETLKVPCNTICVEYFAYHNFISNMPMHRTASEENEIYSYLAFVLSEENGQVKILDIIDIPIDGMMNEKTGMLSDAVKHTDKYDADEIEEIICYLKQIFAIPVLDYLEGKESVYLGLDFQQQTLPMDLIFTDCKEKPMNMILVDSVCYVEEDTWISIEQSNALIIGNPKLKLHGEQRRDLLPSGEKECVEIARMFGTEAYIGREAKQRVLWGKEPRDVIHISTHGDWKNMEEKVWLRDDLFIDSYLMFAGFEDWEEGRKEKGYGNGIVSGDDFLFMDLSRTKLVVLSACVSGLGYSRGLSTIHGMRWAIGAAGAENSVTTLWEVPDDASAVLMIFFYRNLWTMPVGKALYEAKRQLRTATISELKKDNVLRQIVETAQRNKTDPYTEEDTKPYAHWKYWAGFVCYHR